MDADMYPLQSPKTIQISYASQGEYICAAFVPVHILPTRRTPQSALQPTPENRQPISDSSTLSCFQARVANGAIILVLTQKGLTRWLHEVILRFLWKRKPFVCGRSISVPSLLTFSLNRNDSCQEILKKEPQRHREHRGNKDG